MIDYLPIYIASIMIIATLALLSFMAYAGYDVRSRGFDSRGNVLGTFFVNKITFKSYFQRRKQHPVTNEEYAKKATVYRFGFILLIGMLVALIAIVIARYV